MVPPLASYTSEIQTVQNPNPSQKSLPFFSNIFNSARAHVSSHPRFWLFVNFLWIQVLVIVFVRTPTPCLPDRTTAVSHFPLQIGAGNDTSQPQPTPAHVTGNCPSDRIYVYDLPSELNNDLLLRNCTELDPWSWQCGIVTNQGYGGAATELRRFLPGDLYESWHHTSQFSLELLFHHRILNHQCRTMDPESATAFYIPFYAGLAVGKYLWNDDISKRDRLCETMLNLITNQEYWKKSNGSDHFLAIGRITWDFRRLEDPAGNWGSSFLNLPEMKKVTRFIIEKATHDDQDVSVPYPTGFHPKTIEHLKQWQDFAGNYNRSSLFTFIGATRNWVKNDFRELLLNYCRNESDFCRLVDCAATPCSSDSWVILKSLLGSDFCLQPKGDSATRRSVFDCMIAGSIPVFFWTSTAYEQYQWFLPGDPQTYSVFIDDEAVKNGTTSIKQVLMNYSKNEIKRKRDKVISTIPRLIYANPNEGSRNFNDAFDIAINGVLEKIKDEKEWTSFL